MDQLRQVKTCKRQRVIASVLAVCLAVVTLSGPARLQHTNGDVNGDQRVNVLDIQSLVSYLLRDQVQYDYADANADGRIDVLDFQALYALSKQPDEEQQPLPPDPPKACHFSSHAFKWTWLVNKTRSSLPIGISSEVSDSPVYIHVCTVPPRTMRFLRTLTPHAPPISA